MPGTSIPKHQKLSLGVTQINKLIYKGFQFTKVVLPCYTLLHFFVNTYKNRVNRDSFIFSLVQTFKCFSNASRTALDRDDTF
jgi:hypothetical protein